MSGRDELFGGPSFEFTKNLSDQELETMMIHLLRMPALYKQAQSGTTAEMFLQAGYPQYAVLWTALGQIVDNEATRNISWLALRDRFEQMVEDADIVIGDDEIDSIVADPRLHFDHKGRPLQGLLHHAFKRIDDSDLDYGYGSDLVQRFLQEHAILAPIRKLVNDPQFRDSTPQRMSELLERIQLRSQMVEALGSAGEDELFPSDWAPEMLIGEPTYLPVFDSFLNGGQIDGEIFGLLAPFGGGKTTSAIAMLVASARAFLQNHLSGGGKLKHAYFFGYEDGMDQYRVRLLSNAAHILRDRLERDSNWETMTRTGGALEPYEIDYWNLAAGGREMSRSQMLGEYERAQRAMAELKRNCHIIDMGKPGRGTGGLDEIAGILERNRQQKGWEPGIVIVDYAGVLARRFLSRRANATPNDVYAYINTMPDMSRTIARRYRTPWWLLHQYTGLANKKSPAAVLSHTDASGAASFGENCDFCICIGHKDPDTRVARVRCSKARRGGVDGAETFMFLDGAFASVRDVRNDYVIVDDQILPRSAAESIGGGEDILAEPSDRARNAGRRRRGRSVQELADDDGALF